MMESGCVGYFLEFKERRWYDSIGNKLHILSGGMYMKKSRIVYTSGDYEYILLADGTAQITSYTGSATVLTIPDTLDGHQVTSIGDPMLYGSFSLTSITLPEGLTRIADYAFSESCGLTTVTLPEGLTSIGDYAFSLCTGLTSITLPDSVMEMGANPFADCENLMDIRVSPDHPMFANMDGVLFNKAEKRLICCPCAFSATEYQVPEGTYSIGDSAFAGCRNLTSIILHDDIDSIGHHAFSSCNNLISITLPEGLTFIGEGAFHNCTNLTSIALPEALTSIGDFAFFNCFGVNSITLPRGVTSIGPGTFSNCDNLKNITLPDGLTSIGDVAFSTCRGLTAITLPDGLTSIGEYAFVCCLEDLLFTVVRDSYAAQWCKENGKNYTYTDSLDGLND